MSPTRLSNSKIGPTTTTGCHLCTLSLAVSHGEPVVQLFASVAAFAAAGA
jgi:hypothetical protein